MLRINCFKFAQTRYLKEVAGNFVLVACQVAGNLFGQVFNLNREIIGNGFVCGWSHNLLKKNRFVNCRFNFQLSRNPKPAAHVGYNLANTLAKEKSFYGIRCCEAPETASFSED